jgi:hypothetical protein
MRVTSRRAIGSRLDPGAILSWSKITSSRPETAWSSVRVPSGAPEVTPVTVFIAGADTGGDRAAIAYTILSACRLAGVDPHEYLADVLPQLTHPVRFRDLPDLLPSRWAAARAAAAATASSAV